MAGNYPDPPAARMAYDRDGTQVYQITGSGVISQRTTAEMKLWNGEALNGPSFNTGGGGYEVVIFPELRDLKAIAISYTLGQGGGIQAAQSSADTTTGLDGTWNTITTPAAGAVTKEAMRNSISTVVANGIKAIRFSLTLGLSSFAVAYMHLYGQPSANTDRLEFWHPTLDQPLAQTPAWLDWGNRPEGSVATKQFRIKNRSTSLTASPITVGIEALTDSTPTYISQHDFSYNGGAYGPTVTIPSLVPGEISQLFTIRQTLLSNATLGLWTQRVYADAGAWS